MSDDTRSRRRSTREVASSYQALLTAGRWDEWIELWAEDARCEFPYAAEGRPRSLQGRSAILEYMRAAAGRFAIDGVDRLVLHEDREGSTLVAELAIKGHVLGSGEPYNQQYVSVFEVVDGHLQRYREYWNPLVVQAAFADDVST
jgi:uncharacterized protein